jgi:hypothetical protein
MCGGRFSQAMPQQKVWEIDDHQGGDGGCCLCSVYHEGSAKRGEGHCLLYGPQGARYEVFPLPGATKEQLQSLSQFKYLA